MKKVVFHNGCMINDWNSLPAYVVQAPNVDSFKFQLDLFGLNIDLFLINNM